MKVVTMMVWQTWRWLVRGAVVVLLVVSSLGTLAQKVPPTDSSEVPPGQQACLVRSGITICDPDLIEIIVRYNLEVLPAPPPGVVPLEVESLAELESILAELAVLPTAIGGPDPITGPYDPGVIHPAPPGECMGFGPNCGGGGGGWEPPTSPPPPPRGIPVVVLAPAEERVTLGWCRQIGTPGRVWWTYFNPLPFICIEAEALYLPGQRFTAILSARCYLSGYTLLAVNWTLEDTWTSPPMLVDGGKAVILKGGGTFKVWLLFKGTFLLWQDQVTIEKRFNVPSR